METAKAATTAATAAVGVERVPVRRLTVLYDAQCSLCTFVRNWLVRQKQLVPLDLVPVGSDEARRRFPELDQGAAFKEITVVGDAGQVYRGAAAWVVCLWALSAYRPLAHRLSTPSGMRFARGAVLAAAKYRGSRQQPPTAGASGWVYAPAVGWTYIAPPAAGDECACGDGGGNDDDDGDGSNRCGVRDA
ncbi:thiol-disulfide oxidoreductase DCC family protein [Streptomyces sp. NPDC008001]|uniref:thiol-disulfide oxidoreductase DCC family protein n=1 Tax=Streptomyces sp. NPDC008001 TaxID=3364804 RepID=UPI0036DFC8AD